MYMLKKINKIYDTVQNIYFRSVFFIILLVTIYPYTWDVIKDGDIESIMSMLEVLVMITATLAILSLTYSLALKDHHEKSKFIISGGRFFKATLLFIVGILLLHFNTNILKVNSNAASASKQFTELMALIFVVGAIYQFSYGMFDVTWFLFKKKK